MIALVDYGMGNLRSVEKALEFVGLTVERTADPERVAAADAVVLPGVGAFKDAVAKIRQSGLDQAVSQAISSDRPFLGICLGLQMLFSESEEDGNHIGLDIFPGTVRRLPPGQKVPHMGWNGIDMRAESPFLGGIDSGERFYFVHSYYVDPADDDLIATTTDYGTKFCSSIAKGNVFACQFHPEKSGSAGIHILRNFASMAGSAGSLNTAQEITT